MPLTIGQAVQITAVAANEIADKYRTKFYPPNQVFKFYHPNRFFSSFIVECANELYSWSNDPDRPDPDDWFEAAKGVCEEVVQTW